MSVEEFLRRIPKVELHNHVTGAVRLPTFLELARKHDVHLPATSPDHLYDYVDGKTFYATHALVCQAVRDREDFTRIAYEAIEDGVTYGNLKYIEMFFNPTLHMRHGATYIDVVDGLVDGLRRAEDELGVRGRLIPSINRQDSVSAIHQMLDEVIAYRPDEVIGLGMDHDELSDPPEKFASAYLAAGRAGLRRTAHSGHEGPASFIVTCLDLLGCERIDHGYTILGDAEAIARVKDDNIPFTCAFVGAKRRSSPPKDSPDGLPVNPIKLMIEQGIWVTVHTDDPTMLGTDLGKVYVDTARECDLDVQQMRKICLAAVDACWLDDGDRSTLRASFELEISQLEREFLAS